LTILPLSSECGDRSIGANDTSSAMATASEADIPLADDSPRADIARASAQEIGGLIASAVISELTGEVLPSPVVAMNRQHAGRVHLRRCPGGGDPTTTAPDIETSEGTEHSRDL
jgi:hypothetical protein